MTVYIDNDHVNHPQVCTVPPWVKNSAVCADCAAHHTAGLRGLCPKRWGFPKCIPQPWHIKALRKLGKSSPTDLPNWQTR